MMNPSALQKVLNTNELLELILALLPDTQLARAERVCRYWCDVISGSISLQQNLFLRPKLSLAPMPESESRPGSPRTTTYTHHCSFAETGFFSANSVLKLEKIDYWGPGYLPGVSFSMPFPQMASWNPDGKWRHMFLTQPPCETVIVVDVRDWRTWRRARRKKGIRLRHLVAAADMIAKARGVGTYKQLEDYGDYLYVKIDGLIPEVEQFWTEPES